ncbi:cytochrome c biogenesis protein [Luteolibacter sp. GHJ8]|uniref:Cytochrome c biogenesis protein n=1 Tax=Luteolibacter rhizosphaerae TaxID=2989719 RepID=A0ABT3G8P1_9BACT|nr:cytochrome c biogenesis protein [Luteolibacter rhizosphaerae]MCW1916221.1 cytochrome c biogenesis protein [Luteolibacter rhizosphaerae]
MDRWFLIAATALAAVGGITGMWTVHKGTRSRWTVIWMIAAFAAQMGFLYYRGQARGACPLVGISEIMAFLSWSLTLFYLAVGPTYRLSLLGVFTAPLVTIFQILALLPGVWDTNPMRVPATDPWRETHAAMSVLSYGALALAAVAGVMFLVLDRQLKDHHLQSGLFRNLPPVRELLKSMVRLLWIGLALLSVGVVAGFMMPRQGGTAHLVAACVVWIGYGLLLGVRQVRGLTGRKTAVVAVVLFVGSLSVFALV